MANNNKIHFLRGAGASGNTSEILHDGQPVYDTTNHTLKVGIGNSTSIKDTPPLCLGANAKINSTAVVDEVLANLDPDNENDATVASKQWVHKLLGFSEGNITFRSLGSGVTPSDVIFNSDDTYVYRVKDKVFGHIDITIDLTHNNNQYTTPLLFTITPQNGVDSSLFRPAASVVVFQSYSNYFVDNPVNVGQVNYSTDESLTILTFRGNSGTLTTLNLNNVRLKLCFSYKAYTL